jgi:hypothetical protein
LHKMPDAACRNFVLVLVATFAHFVERTVDEYI